MIYTPYLNYYSRVVERKINSFIGFYVFDTRFIGIVIYINISQVHLRFIGILLLTSLSFLILAMPYKCFIGTHLTNDLSNRLEVNDSYISSYYFWWTSATYLPSFLWLTTLYWSISISSISRNLLKLTLILISLCATTEINDLTLLNQNWYFSNYTNIGLNGLLTNSLNYYHPLILYSSFFSLVSILFLYNDSYYSYKYYSYSLYLYLSYYLRQVSATLSLLALFLGSWWAAQEGTWGGWWNWDTSEVLGWLVLLYFFILAHSVIQCQSILVFRSKQLLLCKGMLLTYLLVQVSFELTAHNFGIKFFYFFNNNLFLLEMFFITFSGVVYSINLITQYYFLTGSRSIQQLYVSLKSLTRLLVVTGTVILVMLSTKPLIAYLLWTFVNVNYTTNFITNFVLLFSVLFCFYGVLTYNYCFNFLISGFYISNACCWLWVLLLQLKSRSYIYIAHWLILFFMILNFSTLFFDLSYWHATSLVELTARENSLQLTKRSLLTLSSRTLELSFIDYTMFDSCVESWVTLLTTNSSHLNVFALEITHHNLQNVYQLSDTYAVILLSIELTFTTYLSIITTWVMAIYLLTLRYFKLLT
jgi:hypothetical protein